MFYCSSGHSCFWDFTDLFEVSQFFFDLFEYACRASKRAPSASRSMPGGMYPWQTHQRTSLQLKGSLISNLVGETSLPWKYDRNRKSLTVIWLNFNIMMCGFFLWLSRFIEPVIYGDYPSCMKKIVGSRLPSFTKQESEKLRGSSDFICLIHYTPSYVSDSPSYRDLHSRDYMRDSLATTSGI